MTDKTEVGEQPWEVFDDVKPVRFAGRLLAEASSHEHHDRPRWLDMELYRTTQGRYVLVRIACSDTPGEKDISYVRIVDTAEEVLEHLKRAPQSGGTPILMRLGRELLEEAATVDSNIARVLGNETRPVYVA
jgi:hypothetical protein